jgi:hypothetical protein
MTKPSLRFVRIGVFLFVTVATFIPEVRVLHTGAAAAAPPVTSQTSTSTTAGSRDVCLNCHGPFDKLAATNAKYQAPSGEKISPHRYVPHSAKDVKAIPGCSNCHEPHPVPLTAGGPHRPSPAGCAMVLFCLPPQEQFRALQGLSQIAGGDNCTKVLTRTKECSNLQTE